MEGGAGAGVGWQEIEVYRDSICANVMMAISHVFICTHLEQSTRFNVGMDQTT